MQDLKKQTQVLAVVRFSEQSAPSCMAGMWKLLVVESIAKQSGQFFPISTVLAYTLQDGFLTFGRTEICDGYLFLSGPMKTGMVSGDFSTLSIGGGQQLGTFTLRRIP